MHDIKAIRDDRRRLCARPDAPRAWRMREAIADDLLEKDKALRDLLARLQTAQARRNEASKLIGQAKAEKGRSPGARR